MRVPVFIMLTALLLTGCRQDLAEAPLPTPVVEEPVKPPMPVIVGAPIAITFSGLGEAQPVVTAQTLSGQALTSPTSVTVGETATVRSSTDIVPPGQPRSAGFRYLHVTFPVSVSGTAVTNLTFLGAALNGNPAQSAVYALTKYPGGSAAPYTGSELTALAAAIDPASPVTQDVFAQVPALVPGEEDALQLYNEADVAGLTLPNGQQGSVLPYGFVSHAGPSRTLPVGSNTGTVTLAIKIPLQALPKDDPYTVQLTFVPVLDSVTSITESLEAQLPRNQTAFQAAVNRLGTPVIKTLAGSTRTSGTVFCRVRVAGNAGSPNAFLTASSGASSSPGQLDTCFGSGGIVRVDARTNDDLRGVVVQSSGKIVVAGDASSAQNDSDTVLVRYTAEGLPDTTFGTNGRAINVFGGDDQVLGLRQQTDGKLVIGGTNRIPGVNGNPSTYGTDFAATRYSADGVLDSSFGTNGYAIVNRTGVDSLTALAVQGDNKVVLIGTTTTSARIVRLNANGSLDTTFDTDGIVDFKYSTTALVQVPNAVEIQSDGKIVVAGYTSEAGNDYENVALARFNANGSFDTSFDGDGIVITDATQRIASVTSSGSDRANGLTIQSDGKIVTVGSVGDRNLGSRQDIIVARYLTTGALDTSFGSGGIGFFDPGRSGNALDTANAVRQQTDGKLVIAGNSNNGAATGTDPLLMRLTTTGALDTAYGTQGYLRAPIDSGSITEYGYALDLQSDGKAVAAGTVTGSPSDGFIIRAVP
ncbi:hypothetical protein GO986_20470 [Deinococcus sp. HMF7620]|uniref:Delta-60 repeat protein n=1 Tax=Deinococcus arboris TaxID=2682977 RepID=A0A7C9MBI9_9DEIO|nr:hypothetical protein [Deinococcus arboris]MVN89119.1 hypothetical protein [Deinococcus arboris]